MFKGSIVALVCPMNQDGSIDKKSFCELIEWHIAAGTSALVINGTTGEVATLSARERLELIELAIATSNGRIPVIAGTGTNATATTVENTRAAESLGVAACLLVTPYYNKPTQEGLYQHYKTIADNSSGPLILYNVPGRTAVDLLPETVIRLAEIDAIIGVKEATGKIERCREILNGCSGDFHIYSGDDETSLDLMCEGAAGVISVTANVAPHKMHEMCQAVFASEHDFARQINTNLELLHQRLFIETNPIPVKWALHRMGKIKTPSLRLPLTELAERHHQPLLAALDYANNET